MLLQSNFYDMSSKGDLITKHEANGLGLITLFDHHCIQWNSICWILQDSYIQPISNEINTPIYVEIKYSFTQ